MEEEVFAFVLEFDADALPAAGGDLALSFAVGEACLDVFDHEAEVFGEHAEEEDDPLFVERFMAEPRGGRGIAADGAVAAISRPRFRRRSLRSGIAGRKEAARSGDRAAWARSRKEEQNVGPFAFVFGEAAKGLRERGPGAEMFVEREGIVLSGLGIDATARWGAETADDFAPVFKQGMAAGGDVESVGAETGGADGVIPTAERLQDVVFGDFGERAEFA